MDKSKLIAILEAYPKDRPFIIGLADQGAITLGGYPGHWLFVKDEYLIHIKVNTPDALYPMPGTTQKTYSFKMTYIPIEIINYVEMFIGAENESISDYISGLTPIGTDKTIEEISAEIENSSIRKSQSTRGALNDPHVAPGGDYGKFTGSMISTDINGLPKYIKDSLN